MHAVEAEVEPNAIVTPRALGRYLLLNEIASGGMATIHLGRVEWEGTAPLRGAPEIVAIKRLHPQFAREPDFLAMFLDEARLTRRIFHPNVIRVIDVVAQDDELFIVMEYVLGAPLSLLLRRVRARGETVPAPIAATIVRGVLLGLHAAHEAKDDTGRPLNIVHRDVSPQNILVGKNGSARVFDFGIAKAVGRLQTSHQGQLKGKLPYMAPEQIDEGAVSRRTDVYAASVVLWEALCGRRLFRADDEHGLLVQVLAAEVPAPSTRVPGIPAALDKIVARGLDRAPEHRFETAREMGLALSTACRLASPAEVGAWVASLAEAELTATDRLIAEITRAREDMRREPRAARKWLTSLFSIMGNRATSLE